jgi:thymidine phosphorylase
MMAKVGEPVVSGAPIAMVHARDAWLGENCATEIRAAVRLGARAGAGDSGAMMRG